MATFHCQRLHVPSFEAPIAAMQQCAGLCGADGNLESIIHHLTISQAENLLRHVPGHVLRAGKCQVQRIPQPLVLVPALNYGQPCRTVTCFVLDPWSISSCALPFQQESTQGNLAIPPLLLHPIKYEREIRTFQLIHTRFTAYCKWVHMPRANILDQFQLQTLVICTSRSWRFVGLYPCPYVSSLQFQPPDRPCSHDGDGDPWPGRFKTQIRTKPKHCRVQKFGNWWNMAKQPSLKLKTPKQPRVCCVSFWTQLSNQENVQAANGNHSWMEGDQLMIRGMRGASHHKINFHLSGFPPNWPVEVSSWANTSPNHNQGSPLSDCDGPHHKNKQTFDMLAHRFHVFPWLQKTIQQ